MKYGWNGTGVVQKASLAVVAADLQQAKESGYTSYWLADHPSGGFDALTALAMAGQSVPEIELGSAVIPIMPRHPMALAAQAMTVAQAVAGRFTLGIGLSHASMMAELGLGFDKPIRYLREYLSILMPLLEQGEVDFSGELLSCTAKTFRREQPSCEVVVAALGPQALRVAGRMASGTTLAWVGPKTIHEHIVPEISAAASAAGRPAPRIIATLPVCVTAEADSARQVIDKNLGHYAKLPSYQAMFEREGASGPGEVAIVGSEDAVLTRIEALKAAGVTDFTPTIFAQNKPDYEATQTVMAKLMTAS